MSKFIKSILIFIIPIIIATLGFEILLRQIPNIYSTKNNYLKYHANNVTVLILGSSHSYSGIDPQFILHSFNVANVSQTVDLDLAIYDKYQDSLKNLKLILLPIDYFTLYTKLSEGIERWRIKDYQIYFGIHCSYNPLKSLEVTSNTPYININKLNNYYIKNISKIACTSLGWSTDYNSKDKVNLDSSAAIAVKRHTSHDKHLFYYQNANLIKLISIAKKHNVSVILYTSPASLAYISKVYPEQMNQTLQSITKIWKKNSNVKYYNFFNDKSFTQEDFFDGDHLNEIGAKKLSLKFKSIIHSIFNSK